MSHLVTPTIKGVENLEVPSYSFLVEHPTGRKLLFDLGTRQDWENLSPAAVSMARGLDARLTVRKKGGVRQILEEHGVDASSVEAVVWSHWHFDHTGDPSTFGPGTALIVGPGFGEAFLPGWPAGAGSPVLEADYAGRELREIWFGDDEGMGAGEERNRGRSRVGRFRGHDYFGDGSFYLLDAPGHAVGHLCGLARVGSGGTAGRDSFVFMGGDASHHPGEFRPSTHMPLPDEISPHPLFDAQQRGGETPCPGALFEHLLRRPQGGEDGQGADGEGKRSDGGHDDGRDRPFYGIVRGGVSIDPATTEETIEKMQEADAQGNVLVVIAHDKSLMGVVDFFPAYASDFADKDWVRRGRWAFLKEFKEALL